MGKIVSGGQIYIHNRFFLFQIKSDFMQNALFDIILLVEDWPKQYAKNGAIS